MVHGNELENVPPLFMQLACIAREQAPKAAMANPSSSESFEEGFTQRYTAVTNNYQCSTADLQQ
jgi:hypothetical protein